MPSSSYAKKAILSHIPKDITTLYELGSGWGNLAIPLAKRYPHMNIRAFELSPLPWLVSLILKKLFGLSNLEIQRRNFFSLDLKEAECVICYLFPAAMSRLEKKFAVELQSTCWILSNTFALPSWKTTKVVPLNDLWRSNLYCYQQG